MIPASAGSVMRQCQIVGGGVQKSVQMQVIWPDFTLPPINLFNYPAQQQDYKMIPESKKAVWTPKPDAISSPSHYTYSGFETWDVIAAWGLGYNLGNVVKYISRADHKGKRLEDLQKAKAYLDREIKSLTSS